MPWLWTDLKRLTPTAEAEVNQPIPPSP